MLARVLLAFLFLQLPQNDTIPQGDVSHTDHYCLSYSSFYWHHSGFYSDSMDRLKSEMIITKGLGLLEMTIALD